MTSRFLMGLDAGGGSGRCLLIDVDSGKTTVARRSWEHRQAPDTGGWGYDLDTVAIWRSMALISREALAMSGASPHEVVGIGLTSMRHGMVLLDEQGKALFAVPNRDARAASEGMELADRHGELFNARTGHWPSPVLPGARLLHLRAQQPEILDRSWRMLSISEWLGWMLTGIAASDPSHAGESLLLDLHTRAWASDLIELLGLPEEILPAIQDSGSALGQLTTEAADHLGLIAGIPVAVGGGDTQVGLLGAGVTMPGGLGIVAGTTTPLQWVTSQPLSDPDARLWAGQHVVPGQWVLESNTGGMGEAVEYAARLLYGERPHPAAALFGAAALTPPGARGVLSTVGAEVFNARAMGLPVAGLAFSHMSGGGPADARAALARAVIEGTAFAVRANMESIQAFTGQPPAHVAVTGGMAQSHLWTQLLAEVLAMPVAVSRVPEGTALGAALCAGTAAGIYPDLHSAAQALAQPARIQEPQQSETYAELYETWAAFREGFAPAAASASGHVLAGLMSSPEEAPRLDPAPIRPRILVTAQVDDEALEMLGALGEVTYQNYRTEMRLLSGDDLVDALQGYQVFVTEIDVVDSDALARLPDLRIVVSCRSNAVNVDTAACTAFGIPVLNTPGRNADAVADLAVAFMLTLARKLPQAGVFLREPGAETGDMGRMGMAYNLLVGQELWRKTVGLVGLGAIGRRVVERLLPFGVQVLAYDPYVSAEQAAVLGVSLVSLEELLTRSDFVSLHAPVTETTTGLIGARELALMKPTAFFVNTARAALVDEAALVEALASGRIAGAALDVFEVEPPGEGYPLLGVENVFATPHIGGNTKEVGAHQGQIVAEDLGRLLAGFDPRYPLNPEALADFRWTGPRRTPDAATLSRLAQTGGAAVSDLQAREQRQISAAQRVPAQPEEDGKGRGGLLGGLKKLVGGHEEQVQPAAVSAGGPFAVLEQIITRFLGAVAADPGMQAFAVDKDLVMQYSLTDAGIEFFMSFRNGTAQAGMGKASGAADIQLKMKADIFDGMMTGRVNGTTAAMTGKLKFAGDTRKAMLMQKVQKEMGDLYSKARVEVGDPGDLTGAATPTPPAPAAPAPIISAPASTPAIISPASAEVRAGMERLIGRFLTLASQDANLIAYAAGKDVTQQYTLTDLDLTFYLRFADGAVNGALGFYAGKADVNLKMKAEVLDGMFTGQLDAAKAAMSGRLKFSGDTRKAMGMQKIGDDLARLYAAARAEVGSPGDLSALEATPTPAPAPTTPASIAAPAMSAPTVHVRSGATGDERDELLAINDEMFRAGLITSTGGNVSVRCADDPSLIWITPSQIFKGDLRADMMVRVRIEDGEMVDEDGFGASSERRVHTEILRRRPELNAVVHTHAPWATLLALTETPFLPISTEAAFLDDIPRVPFIMPGTRDLGDAVADAMGTKTTVALMQNHGLVVAGSSLRRAANLTEVVERYSELILRCRSMGIEPALLPDDVVAMLREVGESLA